ncbi:MAG: C25 family cysteine peptidase [Bacteroidales bacterium]|nr:C25 family cysteine peptidase [Bacteroidales bacterium]
MAFQTIKDTLAGFYQSETPPSYFLIIGDRRPGSGAHPHGPFRRSVCHRLILCLFRQQADYFPDMAHGRLSVSSAGEALLVADKIINYEAFSHTEEHFYSQGTNCAPSRTMN